MSTRIDFGKKKREKIFHGCLSTRAGAKTEAMQMLSNKVGIFVSIANASA